MRNTQINCVHFSPKITVLVGKEGINTQYPVYEQNSLNSHKLLVLFSREHGDTGNT